MSQQNHERISMPLQRKLGRNGPLITAVGYGAWAIGGLGYGDQDEAEAHAAIDAYLASGGRFIDTARGYGVSEIMVGKRLKAFDRAEEVFVASKSGATHPPIIRTDIETSRFCLQRDCVDLYYVHVPPTDFDRLRQMLDVFEQAKAHGRIGMIGVSCRKLKTEGEIEEALRYLDDGRIDVLQLEYSYAHPMAEPVIDRAAAHGVGVVTRLNLLKGFLTGRYRPGHRFTDRGNDGRAGIAPESLDAIFRIVETIEREHLKPPYETMTQLALAFPFAHPGVSAIIPGGRSPQQVAANMSVNEVLPMSAEQASSLVAAARDIREYY